MYKKQDKNSMMSWSTNIIITNITQQKSSTTLSPSSVVHCTTEEGDRVVENLGCVIIVIIIFVDQDIIEFLSCFIYIYIHIYVCVFIYICMQADNK